MQLLFLTLSFIFLQEIKDPFMRQELVDRLAAMLNFNLRQLCGSKCKQFHIFGHTFLLKERYDIEVQHFHASSAVTKFQ